MSDGMSTLTIYVYFLVRFPLWFFPLGDYGVGVISYGLWLFFLPPQFWDIGLWGLASG